MVLLFRPFRATGRIPSESLSRLTAKFHRFFVRAKKDVVSLCIFLLRLFVLIVLPNHGLMLSFHCIKPSTSKKEKIAWFIEDLIPQMNISIPATGGHIAGFQRMPFRSNTSRIMSLQVPTHDQSHHHPILLEHLVVLPIPKPYFSFGISRHEKTKQMSTTTMNAYCPSGEKLI